MYEAKSPFLLLQRVPKTLSEVSWRHFGGVLEASWTVWRCPDLSRKLLSLLGGFFDASWKQIGGCP